MARSRKKNPGHGATGSKSNKKFKRQEHQKERHLVKQKLREERFDELPDPKEFGNEWASPRDGKRYWLKPEKDYRIDFLGRLQFGIIEIWKRIMRK